MTTQLIATPFYCFKVPLKITLLSFIYGVTVLIPYRIWMCFFFFLGGGAFKEVFQNKAAVCKITRYRKTCLTGFAWSKVAGDVSAFESTGIYHLNRNRVPEYLFSISYTSETITSIATTPSNMVLVCVPSTSVTNSQTQQKLHLVL